jgi:RND family efflux transporter MFP subunit
MKKTLYAAMAAALVLVAVFLLTRSGSAPAPIATPSVAVQTLALTVTTVPRDVAAYGSITAGAAERDITLLAPGLVETLLVVPGAQVAAGQALAQIAPDAQSVADLRKAMDAVRAAQAAQAHTAALLTSHLATRADLAAATQTLADAQAQLAALRSAGTGLPRLVTAPEAGIVTAVMVPQGSAQAAGTSLLRLADAAHLAAQVGVPEDQASFIMPGAPGALTLLDTGASLPATVASRAAMLDPQTGLIEVTLALSAPAPIGAPVRAALQAGSLTGYAVPRDAVQNDEAGDYVFQQGPDGLAHRVSVKVLGQSGNSTMLAPTLDAKLPLITSGAYQLDDGEPVRALGQN